MTKPFSYSAWIYRFRQIVHTYKQYYYFTIKQTISKKEFFIDLKHIDFVGGYTYICTIFRLNCLHCSFTKENFDLKNF